ncbi:MAG: hypothetical protein NTY64_09710, partial [Deltaproteobacteria bacterium]|nr:hypothetical protein [Deltaproteobacteria bacterium]
ASFVVAAYCQVRRNDEGIVRLASGAFYEAISLANCYEIITLKNRGPLTNPPPPLFLLRFRICPGNASHAILKYDFGLFLMKGGKEIWLGYFC